ncbi:MAG: hypothetical protein LCH30_11485 [Proteobacteria bacterium]|nr:hypothetical protein [Pseudomonadota bacterium]
MYKKQVEKLVSYLESYLSISSQEIQKKGYLDETYIQEKIREFRANPKQNFESYYKNCNQNPRSPQSINNIIALIITNLDSQLHQKILIPENALLIISTILGNQDILMNSINDNSVPLEYLIEMAAQYGLKNIFTLLAKVESSKLEESLKNNIKKAFLERRPYIFKFYIENAPQQTQKAIQSLLNDYYQSEQNFACLAWIATSCNHTNHISNLGPHKSERLVVGIIKYIELAYREKELHTLKRLENIVPEPFKKAMEILFQKNKDKNLDFVLWLAINLDNIEILKRIDIFELKTLLNTNMKSVLFDIMLTGKSSILDYLVAIAGEKIQSTLSCQEVEEAIFHSNLPILDYLVKHYSNITEDVNIKLESTLNNNIESLKSYSNNKVEKLTQCITTLQSEGKLSNIQIQAIINAIGYFLKDEITADDFYEIAQYVEKHLNPTLGILMMTLITDTLLKILKDNNNTQNTNLAYLVRISNLLDDVSILEQINPYSLKKYISENIEFVLRDTLKQGHIAIFQVIEKLVPEKTKTMLEKVVAETAHPSYQWPLLNYLRKQYPDIFKKHDNEFREALNSKLLELKNYIVESSNELNNKKNELVERIERLNKTGGAPKANLLIIIDATYSLLSNSPEITPQKYEELAKEVGDNSSYLMRTIGIIMMAIGTLTMLTGLVLASTGIGLPVAAGMNVVGFSLGLIGCGFFTESKKRDLSKNMIGLGEQVSSQNKANPAEMLGFEKTI